MFLNGYCTLPIANLEPTGLPLMQDHPLSDVVCPRERVREDGLALYLCRLFFLLPGLGDTFRLLLFSGRLSSSVGIRRKRGL